MRRWGIAVVVASACSFSPRADLHGDGAAGSADSGSAAGSSDGALPDAQLGGPACFHDASYAAGPDPTHRYELVTTAMDRDTAFDHCAHDGAHLVVIDDAAENAYVATLSASQSQNVWIGYADLVTEGTFAWIAPLTSSYTSWGSNEPDNGGSGTNRVAEDCVYMLPGSAGLWNDTSCGDQRPSVCECEQGYVAPAPKACRTQAGWTTAAGRRYQQHPDTGSAGLWAVAEATCETSGATLFVPSDFDEISYATGSAGVNVTNAIWIGEYNNGSGSQVWIDSSPVVFTDWESGSPSSSTSDCTEEANTGSQRWTTHGCTDNHPFVCECDPDPPAPPPSPAPTHGG